MSENNIIKIIFFGDIVGKPGRQAVKDFLQTNETFKNYDFIIANIENASHGFGLTEKNYKEFIEYGINCMTCGNHIWDKKDINNYIDSADNLLRPINYPRGTKGVGSRIFDMGNFKIGVINVLGRVFMNLVDSPWEMVREEIQRIKEITPIVVIDFHAEATAEKIAMGRFLDGKVTAVFGTHTHVQTADDQILEKGTAYITDIGMTGPYNSVIGMDRGASIKRFVTSLPERYKLADGNCMLNGCIFEINDENCRVMKINRIIRK